jgi:hypothetical protein
MSLVRTVHNVTTMPLFIHFMQGQNGFSGEIVRRCCGAYRAPVSTFCIQVSDGINAVTTSMPPQEPALNPVA